MKSGSGVYVVNTKWSLLNALSPPQWNDLSKWAIHPPSDPIVQTINAHETKNEFIQLSKGELGPDLFPHAEITESVQNIPGQLHKFGYGDGNGDSELRNEISKYLEKRGVYTSPANILITSGALQALKLISLGILERGSTIFLDSPSYLHSIKLFQSAGMSIKAIPVNKSGLQIKKLAQQKIRNNLSALYINPSYHNPTSTVMPVQQRKQLIETCQYFQLPIVEDDIYRDLWIDEPAPAPIKTIDKHGQVLYIGSFSKTIAAGLRVGWLVGPEDIIKRLSDLRMQVDYGSSYLSQVLVKELLSSGLYESHLEKARSSLKEKRDFLLHLLEQHLSGNAIWSAPTGGFFIWVRFNEDINMRILFKQLLHKGVLINPGFIYNDEDPTVRLSFAYPSFNEMVKGIHILKNLVEDQVKS